MRTAEQLRENCARSTFQTLDLEAAFSSSLFTGRSFTTSRARLLPPPLRAFVKRIDQFTVISALLSTPNICIILSDISL
jgi:hypothetical protein